MTYTPTDEQVEALAGLIVDHHREDGCVTYIDCASSAVRSAAFQAVIRAAMAQAWAERDRARPSYLGPDRGHYEGCCGWEDCFCGSYPNPYADGQEG